MAYYEVEPFGESRLDIQTAMLSTVIANVNRPKKSKKVKFSDFLIDWWKDGSKPQAIMAKFRTAVASQPVAKQPTKAAHGRARNPSS